MKKFASLLLVLSLSLCLASCGGNSGTASGTPSSSQPASSEPTSSMADASAQDIGAKLFQDITYDDDLQAVEEDTAGRIEFVAAYYGIEEALLSDAVLYTGSGATPEEICVMKASSEDNVTAVKEAAEHRLQLQKEDFVDYAPAEMPKLESAVIYQKGLFVVYSVSGDSSKAEEIIQGFLG